MTTLTAQLAHSTPAPDGASSALTQHLPLATLQALQTHLAVLGRVSIAMCSPDGALITEPTWGHRYSEIIARSPLGKTRLQELMTAVIQAGGGKVRSMFFRDSDVYVAPIVTNGQRVALIVCGSRPQKTLNAERIRAIAKEFDVDADELLAAAACVEPWSQDVQRATYEFADLLAGLIATLLDQSVAIGRQLNDLLLVYGLAEMLAGKHDLDEVLQLTVQRIVQIMPVKAAGIRVLNEDTGELVPRATCNLSPEYLRKGPILLGRNPIDAAAFRGETVYIEDATTDPRIAFPEKAREEGIVSGLCAPLTYHGKTVGVIRVYTARRYQFSDTEKALLRSVASLTAAAMVHTQMHQNRLEADRIAAQLRYAGEIQRRMLPATTPVHSRLEFGCVYDPRLNVGGDFYDFMQLADGRIGLTVADVVGKGLPAAMMMASVRSALRVQSMFFRDVAEAVLNINKHMCRDTLTGEFATLLYGTFSPEGSSFTYCNAGHDPPLLLRGDQFIELTAGGMVIGVDSHATYECDTVDLQTGDVLVFSTDGVTDARNFDRKRFGQDSLRASILKHRALDATSMASQMLWDVRRFVGLADQFDDITIVVVRVAEGRTAK